MRAFSVGLVVWAVAGCMPSHRTTPDLAPQRTCPDTSMSQWFFPQPEADNSRLEEWCVTVGPEVQVLEPAGRFGRLEERDSLAVIAWNVAVGAGDAIGFLGEELGLTCRAGSSNLAIGAPHFVLLVQEAFRRSPDVPMTSDDWATPKLVPEEDRPGERLDIVAIAAQCGLSLAYVAAARNGHDPVDGLREDKGVAILSTLPLSDIIAIELPYEAARRVALAATVRSENEDSLRVVSVHLISTTPPTRVLTTGNGSRLRQGLALADALDLAESMRAVAAPPGTGPSISTLLGGDFNTWSERETTLRRLRESFPDSPRPLEEGTHGAFPTDHILFRAARTPGAPVLRGDSYVRLDAAHHSDHLAIRAIVLFGE